MHIGIVSEYTGENQKVFCFKKSVKEIISDEHNPFELTAIRLPYTVDRIEKMTEKRRISLMKKAVLRLKKSGVNQIVLTDGLKQYRNEIMAVCDGISVAEGRKEFYKYIPDAVRVAAKKCSIELLDAKVCISTIRADRITEYLLRKLCYDIKNLTVCTEDTEKAKMLCREFSEETGFFPKITAAVQNSPNRADVLIDLDNARVRIGRNVVIDGVEFDFNLNGFEVNMLDVALCLPDIDIFGRVISYNCGKNKLTL